MPAGQYNACIGDLFGNVPTYSLQPKPATKGLHGKCFSVNFAKILRTSFYR